METLENAINIQNEDKRIGSNFLGILNDLKRRPEDAARELGVTTEEIAGAAAEAAAAAAAGAREGAGAGAAEETGAAGAAGAAETAGAAAAAAAAAAATSHLAFLYPFKSFKNSKCHTLAESIYS